MYNIFTVDMPPAAAPLRYHASLPIGGAYAGRALLYIHTYVYILYIYIYV